MIVVILCGGNGTRMYNYSYPKPLNMIYGKPAITYCLERIPSSITTFHFIVAPHLLEYNFQEIMINEFKDKKCIFHNIPYFTRGPIESAFLGTVDISDSDESIVFLDNDVLYNFPDNFFDDKHNAFIGYAKDNTNSESYSFIKIDHDNVITDIKEKKRISDLFCCGCYGFKNIFQFRDQAKTFLQSHIGKEMYMSLLFNQMIRDSNIVNGIYFDKDVHHIGSLTELKKSHDYIEKPNMRICFDLDNTLVTYPSIPYDYSTVKPIDNMIQLARKMKDEGHTIIIYTARRMKTHSNNVGAVVKDIGMVTLETLERFNIPYDEIIFGKPIADMYIDDRAVNPYRNDIFCMGYIYDIENAKPINSLPPNRYNNIEVINDIIHKTGPLDLISGEMYYYDNLPDNTNVINYFPKYYGSSTDMDRGTIKLEYIHGISYFSLYSQNLLTKKHIRSCFDFIELLHNQKSKTDLPSLQDVKDNYIAKLITRFSVKENYPFDDAELIQNICLASLREYLDSDIVIVPFIHGDLWFSNAIYDFNGNTYFIDMKGRVYNKYTTGGDMMYDYGKLYQSILGFDCALNDVPQPETKSMLQHYFECEVEKMGITKNHLRAVTFSLVIGTMHAIESYEKKKLVWIWIKQTFC